MPVFHLVAHTPQTQRITQPSCSAAGPLSCHWTFIGRKRKTFYIWKINKWNVSTQTILFHIKKKLNVIIIVPSLLSLHLVLSLFQHEGPWPAAVRGHAWDGEREGGEKHRAYRAGKRALLPPAPQVRKWGNNGVKKTKEQAAFIGSWERVWSVCSSHLSHGTTGRALQMGNNCVRVWVHLWVFAGTSVRKKIQSEKGRRTKKRTSVHWFEQNGFLCRCCKMDFKILWTRLLICLTIVFLILVTLLM